ncbi:MAG: GHKL domain-containing protein [Anaerorhabdus sp.]
MMLLFLTFLFSCYISFITLKDYSNLIKYSYLLISFLSYFIFHFFSLNLNIIIFINILLISIYLQSDLKFSNRYFLLYVLLQFLLLFLSYSNINIILLFLQYLLFVLAIDSKFLDARLLEEKTANYQNKVLDQQILEVQNIYTQMRGWRHDFHNHLQSLKAKLKFNQIDEANKYLYELEDELKDIKQIVETGNLNFDAIMNSKLSLIMLDESIQLNYKVLVPENLVISDIDLCALIGNLLDNAYESCSKMHTNKFIRIYIGQLKEQFYISISNSTNETIRKLDNEYITNKRGNHGHGLKRINNIIYKYEGYINRKNEPGVFVTEILLPLK